MQRIRISCLLTLMVLGASPTHGHEFWIDPQSHQVAPDQEIIANIRVGENFAGAAYAYIPQDFRIFELAQGDSRKKVTGRIGDRPAMSQRPEQSGLSIVVHVTTGTRLTYVESDKFRSFVEHKDADWALQAHRERGLPEEGFSEFYTRYAKSLVAVGDGGGHDMDYGLEAEIVALANPYTDEVSGGMGVRVLYRGEPRPSAQVEVFEKAPDGSVTVSKSRTNPDGRATIAVKPGHRYMLDAVVLRVPEAEVAAMHDVVWESLWANLTFAVPAD